MLDKCNFVNDLAVANYSRAMETDTISKNESSLKNLMSRGNFLRKSSFVLLVASVIFCVLLFVGCGGGETPRFLLIDNEDNKKKFENEITSNKQHIDVVEPEPEDEPEPENQKLIIENLINIHDLDNTFFVDMKYATTDNFTGVVLYDGLEDAFLQPDVALMLVEAHRYLKSLHPELRLLIYDAARPLSVQRIMWDRVKDTPYHRYVANPDRLSLHNFGAAVDLTITDTLGHPLDMGTPFDHFGRAAGINDEDGLIRQGLITKQHAQYRQLLRQVMSFAGFRPIAGEWWHFNACSLNEAKQRYTLIEDF